MSKLPLLESVLKYIKENNILFCMPGHKMGRGFFNDEYGRIFADNMLKFDMTEVDGLDNYHCPKGVIKESQYKLSKYYKSKKSYFLVNGSTCGNMIMIFSSFEENDKIIIERNCHKSIYNAVILRKLKPVYVKNNISAKYNAPLSIDLEHFLYVIRNNKDAKGIVVTYPSYYGICANLELIIEEAKKYNMKVLVDCAHGAHFGASPLLPKSALDLGADMVVMSSHKTLPSLTQTAFLHVNNENAIDKTDFYVSIFSTTSPSYIFMCSMDYARYYIETKGKADYEKLIKTAERYKKMINKLNGIHIICKEDLNDDNYDIDLTRYIINVNKGFSGHKLLRYLRSKKIQCEMSDSYNVVLILSPFNDQNDFERLYYALKECNLSFIKDEYEEVKVFNIPEMKYTPYEASVKQKVKADYKDCSGEISATSIIPYPPGIPLIMPGEIISDKIINIINYYINNKVTLLGISENKYIKILK